MASFLSADFFEVQDALWLRFRGNKKEDCSIGVRGTIIFQLFLGRKEWIHMNTVDGCEILHHQKDGRIPINNGMLTTVFNRWFGFLNHPPCVSEIKVCLRSHASRGYGSVMIGGFSRTWTGTARTAGRWKWVWLRSHRSLATTLVKYNILQAKSLGILARGVWIVKFTLRQTQGWKISTYGGKHGFGCEFCPESKNWQIPNICRLTGIESWIHFGSDPTGNKLWTSLGWICSEKCIRCYVFCVLQQVGNMNPAFERVWQSWTSSLWIEASCTCGKSPYRSTENSWKIGRSMFCQTRNHEWNLEAARTACGQHSGSRCLTATSMI